jgi:hypothetical protein
MEENLVPYGSHHFIKVPYYISQLRLHCDGPKVRPLLKALGWSLVRATLDKLPTDLPRDGGQLYIGYPKVY